ncbi:hypothetical protein OG905_00995 [Streptomyces sp. NBC_00322]|uniref:hypothetical protein n=1 Tax=Streptomyces sp. NBC_00322 TaxID=2975712 RepID=UPI002E293189|nr:hypothetical protein [Streptomyces sp. NBC_00322]
MSNPQQLRYTVDITGTDVDAIESFVTTRTAEQLATHDPDTTEHRMAAAVERMLQSAVLDARSALNRLAEPEQAELYGELELRHELKNGWNQLVRAASPWRQDPGYGTGRWCRVTHTNASYERAIQHDMEKARAARTAGASA